MGVSDTNARVVLNLSGDVGDVMIEEISVVEDVVSSSHDIDNKDFVTVYPNPFKDNLVIMSSEKWSRLSIYNVLGSLVYDDMAYQANKSLDLSLQTGIYYVKLKIDDREQLVKVVKK